MENRIKAESNDDFPTFSRLFVVCDRNSTEKDFRDAFSPYGTIENIRIPRDKSTGEPKGIVFIKFSKASEAAAALEAMNFKQLPNTNRSLKIMIASNRCEIQSHDNNIDKLKRLFVNVPKKMTEDELEEDFSQFGRIESVLIQRDRDTHESKGFAYIKYRTFYEAARALEQCNRSYRCIFARPKHYKRCYETAFESNIGALATSSFDDNTALISTMKVQPEGYTHVHFICSPYLTHSHVGHLFDIVPGMINCSYFIDLLGNHGKGKVQYSNPVSAAHAVKKLNEFEYPPGSKIFVKPDSNKFGPYEQHFNKIPNVVKTLKNAVASSSCTTSPDLAQLAEAIAEASKLIKMATLGVNDLPDTDDFKYCSVQLPPTQPLADIDSPLAKRCFLVCKPQPPPLTVLQDVFCRFGNLIDVYSLPNKTVGYARYATVESADEAIKVLHGSEICGVRMKVIEAEDEKHAKKNNNLITNLLKDEK